MLGDGLREGWTNGPAFGAADAEKLLEGTALEPRRRWTGPEVEVLAVFSTTTARLDAGRARRAVAQVTGSQRR